MSALTLVLRRVDRRVTTGVLVVLAAALAAAVFGGNLLRSADAGFFEQWDAESQALVLGHIQQERAGQADAWGLATPEPDHLAPYAHFDSGGGAAAGTSFVPYESQIGLQGHLFAALDRIGCSTVGCLTSVGAGLSGVAFTALAAAVALLGTRSLGIVVFATTLASPWMVAAARNLYWVPWTWALPAVAAAGLVLAAGRRRRLLAGVALFLAVALKCACGYEFVTTVVLLATAMPVLAAATGRISWRAAARLGVAVALIGGAAFAAVLVLHAFLAGGGSLPAGIQAIVADATRRTYGPQRAGLDDGTLASLRVSPVDVLWRYVFGWETDLLDLGVGTRFAIGVGRWGLPVLLAASALAIGLSALRRDTRWRRDLVVLVAFALPPISWFVLAKSHAWTAVAMCYVLWYLLLVPVALWIVGSTATRSLAPVLGARLRTRTA